MKMFYFQAGRQVLGQCLAHKNLNKFLLKSEWILKLGFEASTRQQVFHGANIDSPERYVGRGTEFGVCLGTGP